MKVAVTGAAGQIAYSLLFRVASGAMLGPDQPVALQLLEIPEALGALGGVAMELEDCAFPLLASVDHELRPRSRLRRRRHRAAGRCPAAEQGHGAPGPARGQRRHFQRPGKALAASAARDVRILVVGNPANTNCLIAAHNAGQAATPLAPQQFSAMTRLDQNRALGQVAARAGAPVRYGDQPLDLG